MFLLASPDENGHSNSNLSNVDGGCGKQMKLDNGCSVGVRAAHTPCTLCACSTAARNRCRDRHSIINIVNSNSYISNNTA
jgi:hypothetical protein